MSPCLLRDNVERGLHEGKTHCEGKLELEYTVGVGWMAERICGFGLGCYWCSVCLNASRMLRLRLGMGSTAIVSGALLSVLRRRGRAITSTAYNRSCECMHSTVLQLVSPQSVNPFSLSGIVPHSRNTSCRSSNTSASNMHC